MEKILVLNNDVDTMNLLQGLLQIEGYQVKYCATREDIPGMLTNFRPDLVLLDITRREVMDEISMEADDQQIPILLMTGYNNPNDTPKTGFMEQIPKPFTMDQLLRKVKSMLSDKQPVSHTR